MEYQAVACPGRQMRMKIHKRLISLIVPLLLFLITTPALAQYGAGPIEYIIQRGDTLWGLSDRFLNDPFYWPNLWAKNPQVTNPHLIYPGQILRFKDGKLEIVEQETASQKAAEAAPPEVVEEQLYTVRGNEGWLMEDGLESAGQIVAGQNNRLILGEDDTVYTNIGTTHGGKDGDQYVILHKSAPVRHPVKGGRIGYLMLPVGTLQLSHVADLNSRAIINRSFKEIRPGDLLIKDQQIERRNIPLKMTSTMLEGSLVAAVNNQTIIGTNDVVFTDIGSNQGAHIGNLLYITRKFKPVKSFSDRYVGELPSEVIGAMVLVEVGHNSSTGIVVKSIDAAHPGDVLVSSVQ